MSDKVQSWKTFSQKTGLTLKGFFFFFCKTRWCAVVHSASTRASKHIFVITRRHFHCCSNYNCLLVFVLVFASPFGQHWSLEKQHTATTEPRFWAVTEPSTRLLQRPPWQLCLPKLRRKKQRKRAEDAALKSPSGR